MSLDYKYSLDLLKRFNKLIENDNWLSDKFLYEENNLLQAYQGLIFADIKIWSKNKDVRNFYIKASFISSLKIFVTTLFISSISIFSVLFFILSRRKILIFTGDKTNDIYYNDFRLNPLYKALSETGTDFGEIIHTIPGRSTFTNFLKRKRLAIYLEAPDPFSFFEIRWEKIKFAKKIKKLSLTDFLGEEKYFVRLLLIKYITYVSIFKWRYIFVKFLFSFSNVKKIFAIDDTRHYGEIMLEARKKNILTYAIQHGHFTKYHTGWINMTNLAGKVIKPNYIIVWSEYWKNELINLGSYFTKEEIIIGGNVAKTENKKIHQKNIKSILIPYETDAPKEEVFKYLQKIIELNEYVIYFKVRPDLSIENQTREYFIESYSQIKIIRHLNEAESGIGVVLGTYSTFLYDCVQDLIPVGILETTMDYGEVMAHNNLADKVNLNNLTFKLNELINTELDVLESRKEKLSGKVYKNLTVTLKEIIQSNVI